MKPYQLPPAPTRGLTNRKENDMRTYRELARAAERKRRTFHDCRIGKKRLTELIVGNYGNYAGEQAELLRGYCLYLASRN